MGLTFNPRAFCTLSGLLKVVQIALAIICIALLRHYRLDFKASSNIFIFGTDDGAYDRFLVGVVALGSSVIISITFLIGYVFFGAGSNLLEALFCFVAGVMNVAGGALCIEYYHQFDHDSDRVQQELAMASLMIINALVYLADFATGTLRSTK